MAAPQRRPQGAEIHTLNGTAFPPPPPPPPPRRRKRPSAGYSSFVWLMKIGLPALAVALIAVIVVWPQMTAKDGRFQLGFADIDVKEISKLNMLNPRYYGTDEQNQPFTVTADVAKETTGGSRVVQLDAPKADLSRKDGSWLVLGSDTGYYSQQGGTLDLVGDVNLFYDQGYELHTSLARVDLQRSLAGSDDPTRGQGPFGNVNSEGFRLLDKGKRIIFTGKTRLTLYPASGSNLR